MCLIRQVWEQGIVYDSCQQVPKGSKLSGWMPRVHWCLWREGEFVCGSPIQTSHNCFHLVWGCELCPCKYLIIFFVDCEIGFFGYSSKTTPLHLLATALEKSRRLPLVVENQTTVIPDLLIQQQIDYNNNRPPSCRDSGRVFSFAKPQSSTITRKIHQTKSAISYRFLWLFLTQSFSVARFNSTWLQFGSVQTKVVLLCCAPISTTCMS